MSQILLPIPPHGYDSAALPGLNYVNNVPVILFDDAADERCYWQFRMPSDYGSSPALTLTYSMASATSGALAVEVFVWAASEGESADIPSYASANVASETIPGTAGLTSDLAVTLTNADSVAAGDLVRIALNRDVSADTAAGDMKLWSASLTYTAA